MYSWSRNYDWFGVKLNVGILYNILDAHTAKTLRFNTKLNQLPFPNVHVLNIPHYVRVATEICMHSSSNIAAN